VDFSQWWAVFNDPVLNQLVGSAYEQNLSLQIAGLRIMEVRARLGIAIGNQFPQQQQANAEGSLNQTSKSAPNNALADRYYANYQATFAAAWELRKDKDYVAQDIKEEMAKRTNWGDMLEPEKLEYPPSQDVKSIVHRPDW
jgi:outer membrane protein TolC